ncbi:MAG: hypothetical protein IJ736_00960 [Firmicutes bacterium]|nr:hypothetical protein [Bacillota bacterium]
MNNFQIEFLKAIKDIQETCVAAAMCNNSVSGSREEELYSATSDVIYRIMELLDGYGNNKIGRIDIVKISTGESLKEKPYIELHDEITEYIREL